ncbi:MAG: MmgE/PrpD family protein [Deltaproteobacteria bacterium]|nr:MmgE/PrpD family protein [Deltaproteobacteria bacterium]
MLRLCEFVSDTPAAAIPSAAWERARTVLVDTAGVIVGGSGAAEIGALGEGFSQVPGGSARFGRTGRYAPQDAALLNGLAGSTLEFEEGNSRAKGHPAIQLLPAIAAVSDARRSSGETLLAGIALGYEAAARVSRACNLRKGFHPSGTWGTVGAALGVGRVLSRSAEELAEVANLAAGFCISPYVRNSFSGYSAAATFAALANHLGVLANVFHDSGLRADPASFSVTFSKFVSDSLAWEELTRDLGSDYAIASGYLKHYPSCRFTHPAVDALERLLESGSVRPEEIERLDVTTYDAAAHATGIPRNADALRFSIPYLLAARLCFGELDRAVLTDECVDDPAVVSLAERVAVAARPEYEALRPACSPARVELRLKDGRTLAEEVLCCRGDPHAPLTPGEVERKFLGLAEPTLGPEKARGFLRSAARVEELPDVRELFLRLQPDADLSRA